MKNMLITLFAGLSFGTILTVADHYSVLLWVLGFMLACIATNIRVLTGDNPEPS